MGHVTKSMTGTNLSKRKISRTRSVAPKPIPKSPKVTSKVLNSQLENFDFYTENSMAVVMSANSKCNKHKKR